MDKEKDTKLPNKPIIKDDEIDLVQLVKTIWAGRKIIYKSIGICVVIGLVIAFTSPNKYTVSATLLPSAEENVGRDMGGLGALAGMAGINLSSMMGETTGIPAELYPEIVSSYPFIKELIHQKYKFEGIDGLVSINDYVKKYKKESFIALLKKYTIKLPFTILRKIKPEKEIVVGDEKIKESVIYLTKRDWAVLDYVQNIFGVDVDEETGLVTVSVEMEEPILTTQVAQKVVELLQQYIINYKTEQVRQNLVFVEDRFDEKKNEFEIAQRAFFEYKDSHRNMVSERINSEYQGLSDAYEIAGAVYKGLAQQMEQARIKVKEETPVFTVLEPVKMPKEKSAPRRFLILIVFTFLGGLFGIGIVLSKGIVTRFIASM